MSADPFLSVSLIFPSSSTGLLLFVLLDIITFFYIGKSVTSINNITVTKILKSITWIAGVSFPSLDKIQQYMLGISNQAYQLEVAKDGIYQQVLSTENIGSKYKTMTKLLKSDQKAVRMTNKTIIDLIRYIKSIVTTLKKNSDIWLKTLSNIEQYQGRAFHNRFYNINKVLGSNKFFYYLGMIIRQYKRSQILISPQAHNNITAHRLLTTHHRLMSNHY